MTESVEPTPVEQQKRTGYLELFFDLVFVFAFTQVTTMVVDDTSAAGLGRAALVFALVWWAWSAYAWLTNAIDVENIATRLFVFTAMVATFFLAIAVPDAFADEGAWFAVAYFAVRVLHVALYLWGVRDDPGQRRAVARLSPWFLIAPVIALGGGFVDDSWRTALWTVSVAIDVAGTLFASGFSISVAHFAERYALIVIIALGESIVAIGVAAVSLDRDPLFAVAVGVSFAVAAAAWWAYFDASQVTAERVLHEKPEEERGHLARDIFTFFHYPIVLGIILLAVAAKKTLAAPDEPLSDAGRAALALGMSLFLLGFVLMRYRVVRRIAWERLGAAVVVVAAVLGLGEVDSLLLLALAVAALVGALAVEALRLRAVRADLKHAPLPH